ncbi:MAG: hypothetical protein IJW67_05415 [Blautia sp.]|nr:hypothetical protein [Blautia sp.]
MKNIYLFEDYLRENGALSSEEMDRLYEEMAGEIGQDEDALELYGQLLETAIRYANFRAKWCLMTREEKLDADGSRTSCHNSVITKINMLSRYLRMQGKSAAWRDVLGDESVNRKRIGDFACYLVFVSAVNAR